MERILLINDEDVREMTNVSANISGKLIGSAIYEAQDVGLRSIFGDRLYDKVLGLVETGDIDLEDNEKYKILLNRSRYYLAYEAISNVCMLTAVKIDNAGLQQVSDERMNPISITDSFSLQSFYQKKSDYYCSRLQSFIEDNRSDYPELSNNNHHGIKSNLYSSANSTIWLGGPRCPKNRAWRLRDIYND